MNICVLIQQTYEEYILNIVLCPVTKTSYRYGIGKTDGSSRDSKNLTSACPLM